jgi:hypothetical protein
MDLKNFTIYGLVAECQMQLSRINQTHVGKNIYLPLQTEFVNSYFGSSHAVGYPAMFADG